MRFIIRLDDGIRDDYGMYKAYWTMDGFNLGDFQPDDVFATSPYHACIDRERFELQGMKARAVEMQLRHENWTEARSLTPPIDGAEAKINELFDNNNEIVIVACYHPYYSHDYIKESKKWLDDHYIPYDRIICPLSAEESIAPGSVWVETNIHKCFRMCKNQNVSRSIIVKRSEYNEETVCRHLGIPTPLPPRLELSTWHEIRA